MDLMFLLLENNFLLLKRYLSLLQPSLHSLCPKKAILPRRSSVRLNRLLYVFFLKTFDSDIFLFLYE